MLSPQLHEERPFPARPEAVREIRRFVWERVFRTSFEGEWLSDLLIAVSEAATNAVRHSGTDRVVVTVASGPDAVEVRLADGGTFHGPAPRTGADDTAGRGLPLMSALVDEVAIRHGTRERPGTEVLLRKRLPL